PQLAARSPPFCDMRALAALAWPVGRASPGPTRHGRFPAAPLSADASGCAGWLRSVRTTLLGTRREQSRTARPPSRPATLSSPEHAGIAPVAPKRHNTPLLPRQIAPRPRPPLRRRILPLRHSRLLTLCVHRG